MKVSEIDETYSNCWKREFPRVSRIRVLGDSLAAGWMVDGAEGQVHGTWGEMVAAAYRSTNPDLDYRNCAAHGATSADVRFRQTPAAARDSPDLALVVCGANDILGPTFDVEQTRNNIVAIATELADAGSTVLLLTTFDSRDKRDIPEPFGERVRTRHVLLRDIVVSAADSRRVHAVDLTGEDAGRDPAVFSSDGLHINHRGQKLIANHIFATLAACGW